VNFQFDALNIGERYDRMQLASFWGYKARQAISRGIVTPRMHNLVILFVTENKLAGMTPYADRLVGGCLQMEGDGLDASKRRLAAQVGPNPPDDVYLFFRREQRDRFIYCGRVVVTSADSTHPNGYYWMQLDDRHLPDINAALSTDN